MIDLFLIERSDRPDREEAWWGDPKLSVEEACARAMFALEESGRRDGHQWVFRIADLRAMGAQIATHATELAAATSFGELYRGIERALGLAPNRKPLLVYDVARRLGYRLKQEPEEVYLHAGPRIGANALKQGLGRPRSRPLSDFPTSIRNRLTAAQAEDFLCLAAPHLKPEHWD